MPTPTQLLLHRWEARINKYDKMESSPYNEGFITALEECSAELANSTYGDPQQLYQEMKADEWLSSVEAHEPSNYY